MSATALSAETAILHRRCINGPQNTPDRLSVLRQPAHKTRTLMQFSYSSVNVVDWTVVGICGVLFFFSIFSIVYVAVYSSPSYSAVAREFNYLWRARVLSQVIAAVYALSQLLRLQVLWGPQSVVLNGGYHTALLCRIFTALTFGLLEPAYLLLGLFSCIYSVKAPSTSTYPNVSITVFALGFTLPALAAQLVCALFTEIVDLNFSEELPRMFFTTYDTRLADQCQPDIQPQRPALQNPADLPSRPQLRALASSIMAQPDIPVTAAGSSDCVFCTFALLSTAISAFCALCFLLVAWRVTQHMARAVINKALISRIRTLQLLVIFLLPASLACRGLTVLFQPFDVGFELLRLGNVVCVAAMILAISFILVLKPVHDAYVTDKHLKYHRCHSGTWTDSALAEAEPPMAEAGSTLSQLSSPSQLEAGIKDNSQPMFGYWLQVPFSLRS